MKRIFKLMGVLLAMGALLTAQAQIGASVGEFSLETGDGKQMLSSNLYGKITVLFYETKDNTELNRMVKDQLNALFGTLNDTEKKEIIRLPAIDCSDAFWPFVGIWKNQLIENTKIEGMDIYGDWDGSLKPLLSFDKNEAYVVIIDRKGTVCFIEKGQLTQEKIDQAKEVLLSLL